MLLDVHQVGIIILQLVFHMCEIWCRKLVSAITYPYVPTFLILEKLTVKDVTVCKKQGLQIFGLSLFAILIKNFFIFDNIWRKASFSAVLCLMRWLFRNKFFYLKSAEALVCVKSLHSHSCSVTIQVELH